jgi:hypothetical protein
VACHNSVTLTKDSVVMPSGLEITGLGDESRCMECHQGRESTVSVTAALTEAGVDDDTVSEDLSFVNLHYYAAAATKYGTLAKGGYEYEGKAYDGNFAHVTQFDTCIECHDTHTLQVKVEQCSACHDGVAGLEDLRDIRMEGSLVDYDGDGDIEEGVAFELEGLQEALYEAIRAYAADVAGSPVAYSTSAYPYFFIDSDDDGEASEDEAVFDNRFASWTPRLVKAAYNYQTSLKDPGAFAHGGKYIIQLLYDSIEDLNSALSTPVDLSTAHRIDRGHFAGSEEAFRHWDADGEVPATCSKCHSAAGLPLFLKDHATISQPISNGLQCSTCHESVTADEVVVRQVEEVTFPSGLTITADQVDGTTLLCMNCHQGRESTTSVNRLVEGLRPDNVAEELRFLNVHYFAAGATRFGTEAKGAYEYEGQTYNGFFLHRKNVSSCTDCHSTHELEVQVDTCSQCHDVTSVEDLRTIRESLADFDGDGDTDEGIAGEIETMHEALYAAIQAYATNVVETSIVYTPQSHPYFFIDSNGNGEADADEVNSDNRYVTWTPRLLEAAYNYQYVGKDPGAFAHNGQYILQVLYDSLKDVGGDTTGMERP